MGTYMMYYASGIIILPVFIFSLICQAKVKASYRKYNKIRSMSGMTGAQAAYRLMQLNGVNNVKILNLGNRGDALNNYYDPKTNAIYLSNSVYNSTSISAIGIACHEAGHACQYAESYAPIKLRSAIIPATRFGTMLGVPLCLIGMFINLPALAYAGVILYGFVALFQLATLPVEFNASSRALNAINDYGFLNADEYRGAKSVLTAAALTYVAALASALVTILRLLLVINGGGRRR